MTKLNGFWIQIAIFNLLFSGSAVIFAQTTDALPQFTVSYFNSNCPSGWTLINAASGRFMLPSMQGGGTGAVAGIPLTPGATPTHPHSDTTASIGISKVEYIGIDSCCNESLSSSGTYSMTGTTVDKGGAIPFVQYMICMKMEAANTESVPDNLMNFYAMADCPTGWDKVDTAAGRYIIGLPDSGSPSATFGGKTMGVGEIRTHEHSLTSSIDLPGQHVALGSGCCAHDYASAGTTNFSGTTNVATPPVNPPPIPKPHDSAIRAPYYTAPLCVKD